MDLGLDGVSDEELERKLKCLAAEERERTAEVLRHLAEFDRRALPMQRAHSWLWKYCTTVLRYSEKEAWYRVQAARAASKVPAALDYLRSGRIQLCGLAFLNAHLKEDNAQELLFKAAGKSYRDLEAMLAEIAPKPDKRDHIQTLSVAPPPAIAAPGDLPLLEGAPPPAAPQEVRVHFSFTGDEALRKKIERAKQLLWHPFPDGRLEDVLGAALDDLLEKRDPARKDPPRRGEPPAARSRYIPVWVRAEVWKRDGGRCAFETGDGVRCGEESALEYDHVIPYALGGASDDPANIRLLCFAHNQLAARETFGASAQRGEGA